MSDVPGQVGPLLAAASKPQSSGSSFIYILLIVGVGFYFLIYRPQQRKAKAVRERANAFEVGDEVVTAGGIVGHVIDIDGDRITLETSVGASFVVLRPYVLRKLEPPVVDQEEHEVDADVDHHDAGGVDASAHEEPDGHAGHEDTGEGDGSHRDDGYDQPSGADGSPAA